jgi:hypothetical protein
VKVTTGAASKIKLPHFFITLSLASIIAVTQIWANEGTQADLAKQAQNPVANMISVPFENSTNYGIGPEDKTDTTNL